MSQLQHTRLECIEFCYLVVGHTHDLIDAIFAFVSKAVHAQDVLSVPDFFTLLNQKMKNPPLWKHLRDVFGFRDDQPAFLSSKSVKGITLPHHVRLSCGRDGSINVQSKRWLTTEKWSDVVRLCSPEQVRELRNLWYPLIQPAWESGFEGSAVNWLNKLKDLLAQAGKPTDPLIHCQRLIRHELHEYLPSGETLQQKIARLRKLAMGRSPNLFPSPVAGLNQVCAVAFPGSAIGGCTNLVFPNKALLLRPHMPHKLRFIL